MTAIFESLMAEVFNTFPGYPGNKKLEEAKAPSKPMAYDHANDPEMQAWVAEVREYKKTGHVPQVQRQPRGIAPGGRFVGYGGGINTVGVVDTVGYPSGGSRGGAGSSTEYLVVGGGGGSGGGGFSTVTQEGLAAVEVQRYQREYDQALRQQMRNLREQAVAQEAPRRWFEWGWDLGAIRGNRGVVIADDTTS